MTEKRITRKLFHKHLRQDTACHNAYIFLFESDVLAMKPSGFITEYEIKLSVSDFKADAQKVMKWGSANISRYSYLLGGNGANRFYYVMPRDLISKVRDDIPAWAGIISVSEHIPYSIDMSIRRSPKLIHSLKYGDDMREKIRTAMYWKSWKNL